MAYYHACRGCVSEGGPCEARDKLRSAIAGFNVTSVKWKCHARQPRLQVGQPVWALTVPSYSYSHREPDFAEFPAVMVGTTGAKALVYIAPDALSRDEEYGFEANGGSGFCALPFKRIAPRDGDSEAVCRFCLLPASRGHTPGYRCSPIEDERAF